MPLWNAEGTASDQYSNPLDRNAQGTDHGQHALWNAEGTAPDQHALWNAQDGGKKLGAGFGMTNQRETTTTRMSADIQPSREDLLIMISRIGTKKQPCIIG